MDQDEQVAVRHETTRPLRLEPEVVPAPETPLSPRLHAADSPTVVCSLIEERITWPVRSVLCGGGEGNLTPYRDCSVSDIRLINRMTCGPETGMRSGRPKAELVLSRDEREALERLTRRRKTAAGRWPGEENGHRPGLR